MALPITVTYTFANATTSIPLSQLDTNFTVVSNGVNGIGNGTNALSNVSITGGTITGLSAAIPVASGGTGLTAAGTAGNVLTSDGTNFISSATSGLNTAVQGAFKNLKVQVTGNTSVVVTADAIVLSNGTLYSTVKTVNSTISTASVGANGLDTGSLTAATWYYAYVIFNGTTTAGLLSTSSTSPTLPSGYTYYARVGAVYATTGPVLARTLQYGRKAQYVVTPTSGTTALPLIGSSSTWQGVSVGGGSATTPTWGSVPITSFVPATASQIGVVVMSQYLSGALAYVYVAPNGNYSGYTGNCPAPIYAFGVTVSNMQSGWITIETSPQTISAFSSNTGGAGMCIGWEDNL